MYKMSSFPYASLYNNMVNPANEDLDMTLHSILNVDLVNPNTLTAANVNVESSLNIQDTAPSGYQVTLTAMDLAGNAAYNFPPAVGHSGQVLALDGGSGQLAWIANGGGSGAVLSVNDVVGAVILQSMTLTITPDQLAGTIALDVTNPLPVATTDGEYPAYDTGTSAYVAHAAPVTSLTAPVGDPSLTGNMNFTSGGTMTITGTEGAPNSIAFDVALPLPTGTTNGDFPVWDNGGLVYAAHAAPVYDLNGCTTSVSLTAGAGISVTPNTLINAVDIANTGVTGVLPDGGTALTGDVNFSSPNGTIAVGTDTGNKLTLDVNPLPVGLASPAVGDYGNSYFSVTGIGAALKTTSSIQACIQYPDTTTNIQQCWLVYANPSDADGGTITFNMSDLITNPSTLQVSWAVTAFN